MPFDSANPAAFASSVDRIRALQAGHADVLSSDGPQQPSLKEPPQQHGGPSKGKPTEALPGPKQNGAQQPGRRVHVVCRRGNDSQLVVDLLRRQGVSNSIDMIGGLQAWAAEQDATFPQY